MQLIRYQTRSTRDPVRIGVRDGDGRVCRLPWRTLAELLTQPLDRIRSTVQEAGPVEGGPVRLLPPIDGCTEVWASGVTYQRSRAARVEESRVADVYDLVYDADRPELFLKSVAWRVVGDGEPIGIREDSRVDVPEPELALVVNAHQEVVGATICNDVSSRSIEGENPLYLPQAKTYAGGCALGPGIVPGWTTGLTDLEISATVLRDAVPVWQDRTSTSLIRRSLDDLVGYLFRGQGFPHGVVLSTGTGIVPGLDVTLRAGDVVTVEIEGLGRLTNPVRVGARAFDWIPVPEPVPGPARATAG